MAASELLCRAHSSSAQRSRPPVTSPRRLHPARGGRHHPWAPPLPLSLPPPSPSDSSPPPGLIRGVQRPPRTNMGTHLGIADPPAPCRRRRRPCRPRFHPLALLPTPSGRQQKHADRTLRTSPSCSRQAWLAACWGVVFVCVVYSLSTQCICYVRKVKNSQARTGHQRGMDGRETDDDDTLERHTDTNKLTGHSASWAATHHE